VRIIIFAVSGFFILLGAIVFVSLAKTENRGSLMKNSASSEKETGYLLKLENPRIVVKKAERVLQVFDGEKLFKTYQIALGFAPAGDKEKQGDGKTPEGEFYIFTKNSQSKFYLSLGLSYPNLEDAERGLKAKLISEKEYNAIVKAIGLGKTPPQYTALGGEIYIHGGGSGKDWTWGCVALENEGIKEIYDLVSVGTKVVITP
jgi:murein L,D-transpeptidase YafK